MKKTLMHTGLEGFPFPRQMERFMAGPRHVHPGQMVEAWLVEAMERYNEESLERREAYAAQVHLPGSVLQDLVWWALQALPDEILVGLDVDGERPHQPDAEAAYAGESHRDGLFAGQGFVISEAAVVNRGDSYSVHHLPEDWTDDLFRSDRGNRGGRFTHWLHTHPNAPAVPSGADADAAQETLGVDMILGLRFSPEGPLPWFDDVDGTRRTLAAPEQPRRFGRRGPPVLGVAPSGHRIHEIQLIAFHRTGLGVNVVLVDEDGWPYGWTND